MTPKDIVKKIEQARVYDVAIKTPLDVLPKLSERLGHKVHLKREDLQPVFSFKLRGAYNKMIRLNDQQRAQGVVAASAGNHAQGVALAAKKLGMQALIVMPESTPQIKVKAVKKLGGKVLLFGDSFQEAEHEANQIAKKEKRVFIHPYDDADVIAGQGTIAKEVLEQHPDKIDIAFVCVGGGGLISGVASYLKSCNPKIKIIGVEPIEAASMTESLKAKERVVLPSVGIFADGAAVKKVGKLNFALCQDLVDDMVTVTTDEICAAIKDVFEDTRALLEPAGALSVAGASKYFAKHKRKKKLNVVTIASGANMNFHRLRHVSERAELGEKREAIVAVTIPEKPGSFRKLIKLLGKRQVTEFNYRYADAKSAHVFMGFEIHKPDEAKEIVKHLKAKGFAAVDLSDNEVAKLHVRHMVGGPYRGEHKELLLRFEFPERVGALSDFLNSLSPNWNISLFHYRNHGTDYGRVLVGMEVPEGERLQLKRSMKKLGYSYWEESDNPVCRLFLSS
ncbi:MAG: threonine ammonia-lyase, biosynthetic [Deltaproteobacteria bacterium]|nr:threonine ammonia-lyase, biosynthetic [Deltaproteobacteria bacterium]